MKKFTKTLALTGALMLSSLGLVACGGGNNDLVDIKGNYSAVTEDKQARVNSCVASLDSVTLEENQSYEININLNVTTTAGDKTAKGKSTVKGNIGTNGDFYLDMVVSQADEKMAGAMYFEVGEPSMLYVADDEAKLKIECTTLEDADDYMQGMGEYVDQLNPKAIKDAIDANKELTISYAETDSYLKIKYEQTIAEDVDGSEGSYTYYIVFDKIEDEYSFAGARMEMDFTVTTGGLTIKTNGYFEFKPSTKAVKTLTDAEKEEYIDISSFVE